MLVYCIEFPNGKRYVGKTECDLGKRKKEHKHHSKKGTTRLYNAIRKYGWKNLKWSILDECECSSILSEREIYWISHFDCLDRDKGYNLREGGEGGRHSEETKEKISKSNMGENNGMYGQSSWNAGMKMSEEYKKKLSESHKGQKAWNKGMKGKYKLKPRSVESKKRISEANSGANNGRAKLDVEKVKDIRKKYETGEFTMQQLAELYGVKQPAIYSIVRYKSWKNI